MSEKTNADASAPVSEPVRQFPTGAHDTQNRARAIAKAKWFAGPGYEKSLRGPYAYNPHDFASILRGAGLLGTLDDLKAAAKDAGVALPGLTAIKNVNGAWADALSTSASEMLRAWAFTYAPEQINPHAGATHESVVTWRWW